MKKNSLMIAVLSAAFMASCTWVEPTNDALNVRVAYLSQVGDCKQLGRATVSVMDKVVFFDRAGDQVSEELETLGRNAAAEMNGDTIVAMSKVMDGEQVFNVYRCK